MSSETASLGPMTPLETVTLVDEAAHARVVVAPARGGMVTRFDVAGRPVLFLDVASLVDVTKNVRGGIPVLFPSPGPLEGERFSREGRSGSMKQHGFARQRAWSVLRASASEVTLELRSDDATRAQFPWDFVARLRYALLGTTLTLEMRIENTSDVAMPFALGFHPYFHVDDAEKTRASIATRATRAFDNVKKQNVEIHGAVDLTAAEVDLHLDDHAERSATLQRGDDRIVVAADAELGRWVIWTLAGKDFVCLEPWSAGANALNTGEHLMVLAPGAAKTLSVSITLDPARA
jgi:galactose mutarotase-like enzyme